MDATEKVVEVAQEKIDDLVEKDVDSVDSEVRYLAYGARLRTALRAGTRYIAYVRQTPRMVFQETDTKVGIRPLILERLFVQWFLHG